MDKQMFEGHLSDISGAMKQKFSNLNLSEDEIKATHGDPEELIDLVCSKTGVSREEATKQVNQVMSSLSLDDSATKSFGEKISAKFDEIKDKFTH